jgi:hypothetical protein
VRDSAAHHCGLVTHQLVELSAIAVSAITTAITHYSALRLYVHLLPDKLTTDECGGVSCGMKDRTVGILVAGFGAHNHHDQVVASSHLCEHIFLPTALCVHTAQPVSNGRN